MLQLRDADGLSGGLDGRPPKQNRLLKQGYVML
jgi:hypothetical protein